MKHKNKPISSVLRNFGLAGLLILVATTASATPISIEFGDVSVAGFSDTSTGEPTCPPGESCDFRPGARVSRVTVAISRNIRTANPLEITLFEDVHPDFWDSETLAFWEERSQAAEERIKTLKKMTKTKRRELRAKRRPPSRRTEIRVPDNDNDPFLFLLEFDADSGPPEFLTLNVVDSVTGEFSNTQINLAPVPEPATSLLFVTGLIGLAAISRKKLRKK